jgi:membrane protein insertase Oxa1/YidC/SpoIIIJ
MPKLPARKEGDKPDIKSDFARNMQVQMKYIMPLIMGVIAYSISVAIALYFWSVTSLPYCKRYSFGSIGRFNLDML